MTDMTPRGFTNNAEALARLSKLLRLLETQGSQCVSVRRQLVVSPAQVRDEGGASGAQFGRWLIENTPRDTKLEIPDRHKVGHEITFSELRPWELLNG